jgi:hypothetical protein
VRDPWPEADHVSSRSPPLQERALAASDVEEERGRPVLISALVKGESRTVPRRSRNYPTHSRWIDPRLRKIGARRRYGARNFRLPLRPKRKREVRFWRTARRVYRGGKEEARAACWRTYPSDAASRRRLLS